MIKMKLKVNNLDGDDNKILKKKEKKKKKKSYNEKNIKIYNFNKILEKIKLVHKLF